MARVEFRRGTRGDAVRSRKGEEGAAERCPRAGRGDSCPSPPPWCGAEERCRVRCVLHVCESGNWIGADGAGMEGRLKPTPSTHVAELASESEGAIDRNFLKSGGKKHTL